MNQYNIIQNLLILNTVDIIEKEKKDFEEQAMTSMGELGLPPDEAENMLDDINQY